MATIFDNNLKNSGLVLNIEFDLKTHISDGNVADLEIDKKIDAISIQTENLNSSIIYAINEIPNTQGFSISLADLESIKRLNLKNQAIDFNINEISFSLSILNLIQLSTVKILAITKAISDYIININFNIISHNTSVENATNLNDLLNYMTNLENEGVINKLSPDKTNASASSMETRSELNSLASITNNNSSSSLNSLSVPSRRKNNLVKLLTPRYIINKRIKSGSNFSSTSNCNSKSSSTSNLTSISNSNSNSNPNSNSNSSVDLTSASNPGLYHDDTDGFLILQIESATGLPPFKNSTHLGYDMDPFVVVSFSKQIFKTYVCRHALNPSWKNQLINIRVSKYSFNFKVRLSVYDFDFFTFNEDICSASIEISTFIDESEYNHDDSWTYKTVPLIFSQNSLSKKLNKLEEYNPQLSIRFKYVPVNMLSSLIKDFNPKKTKCPYCNRIDKRNSSALQHLSICKLNLKPNQFLHKSYATSNNASRRWYVKILAYIAYGRLTVGGNNAHILVQDRETGLVLEEKISAFVKLGIRLLYKSVKSDNSSEKIKDMLRILSIKQGKRYDHPSSKSKIKGFVKFHGLESTLQGCLNPDISSYKSFNEFFSRKLKVGSRPLEGGLDNSIIVSMADSRLIVFNNLTLAKSLWIKGNGFTIEKLLGKHNTTGGKADDKFSVAIFRLAPQDYHRVHSPLNGKIIKISHIHGSYYTVNPMAVRSALDVFGENVRTIITLKTEEYGNVEIVMVGAMMVGSILISVKLNDYVKKGQELGYFKFGGSTVILIFKNHNTREENNFENIKWDGDLISNSNKKLETLVKVGMSVGHSINHDGYHRGFKTEVSDIERREIIRRVTGLGDGYGIGVSENIKAKLGGMFDDVMSMKSRRTSTNNDATINDLIANDWEIHELTTLDDLNDNEAREGDDNEVDIALARELQEAQLYEMIDSDDETTS